MRKIYIFNEDKEGFSSKLKELMTKNGYTVNSLADKIGYDINTIKKWRAGKRTPNLDIIAKLSKLFGTTMQELYLPNSLYQKQISDSLLNVIDKKNQSDNLDKTTMQELTGYSDYLFQKMLFSFVDLDEQQKLESMFRFYKVTPYGREKMGLGDSESSFPDVYIKTREYINKQYGLSFPYKNNETSRISLLKEFSKWISLNVGGACL